VRVVFDANVVFVGAGWRGEAHHRYNGLRKVGCRVERTEKHPKTIESDANAGYNRKLGNVLRNHGLELFRSPKISSGRDTTGYNR
jgi:hypothetical protein